MDKGVKIAAFALGTGAVIMLALAAGTNNFQNREDGVLEQVKMEEPITTVQPLGTGTEQKESKQQKEAKSTKAKEESKNQLTVDDITLTEQQVHFIGKECDSDFAVSRMDAASKALNAAINDVAFTEKKPEVVLAALNSSAKKSYQGYMNVNDQQRYYFTVNGMTGEVSEKEYYTLHSQSDYVWGRDKKSNQKIWRVDEYNLPQFDTVKLEVALGADCEICYGESYSVTAYIEFADCNLECQVKDQELIITTKHTSKNFVEKKDARGYITVTVPKDAVLKKVVADNVSSDVKLRGIQSEAVNADLTSGDFDMEQCTVKCVSVDNCSGNITMDDWKGTDLLLDITSGDITLADIEGRKAVINGCTGKIKMGAADVEESMKVENVSGDILISAINCPQTSIANSSGNIDLGTIRGNSKLEVEDISADIVIDSIQGGSAEISNTSGNIQIDEVKDVKTKVQNVSSPVTIGKASGGELQAEVSFGDVAVKLVDPSSQTKIDIDSSGSNVSVTAGGEKTAYSYELNGESHRIYLGGEQQSQDQLKYENGDNIIRISTTQGEIHLTFEP